MTAYAQYDIQRMSYSVVFTERYGGLVRVARPVEMEMVAFESGTVLPAPTLSLSQEHAQQLVDQLWDAGVRPTGVDGAGETAALKKHIEFAERVAKHLLNATVTPRLVSEPDDHIVRT